MDPVNLMPMITFTLIAITVANLQLRKARRFEGLKRRLAFGVMASNTVTAGTIAVVVIFQGFDWPGPGILIVASILLSIALWTASLIWAGPAEKEDRLVFLATVGLMGLTVLSALLIGLAG